MLQAQSMKVGFVAYRDFGGESGDWGSELHKVLPFVDASDVSMKNFCNRLYTGGGSDCEDVIGGMDAALKLPWSEDCGTKLIFHIADMPCHGREFHNISYDSHPNGDPQGRTPKELFSRLREKGIQYYFGKIGSETDLMIQKFSALYGEAITEFDVKNVVNIKDSVITAVSNSITASVSSSQRAVGVARALRAVTLHPAKPNWSTLPEVEGNFVSYEFPARIKDIKDDVALKRKKSKSATVKIAPNPFGKGAERIAFYGKDVSVYVEKENSAKKKSGSSSSETPVKLLRKDEEIVAKEYLHVGKGMNTAKRYELSNQMQTVAAYLAQEFVKDLKVRAGISKTIKFIKIRTLYLSGTPARFMSCERCFAPTDKFVRFSNNAGYQLMEDKALKAGVSVEFVQLVTAFSHWTYKATKKFLMVVDLEGVVAQIAKDGKTGVLLTDPAIHCEDRTRYGPMNHGPGGMKNFFATHKCNEFCKKLGLEGFV
ncbi:hypothetical protein PFISCL1PPCAC_7343 [Pristionchus fissidentatus]|uniref:Alpha-type protein kinase domain-containing protein n=1 Tax=Pristionchus fissidentatus TaxID=1538716 RepID=A0AAV5V9M7_9BILA|nr:hypothetical protein PFISCL1PPCAC_7343 [Pristionchus fissidentatus]